MVAKLPFEVLSRKVLEKKKAETNPEWGCDPSKLPAEELIQYGVVNIDKPKGPTSHQVSAFVQKILGINKSGHSGTLDPRVTGVLAIAVGRATKVVEALLSAGKEYVCIMHLHKPIEPSVIQRACAEIVGDIKQLPPIKSSVKRQERKRTVYYVDVLEIDEKKQDVLFVVGCQAGTYIRKLCHDLGEKLGCGAHMAELRRTKAGPFQEDSLVTLQTLTDAVWLYKEKKDETLLRECIQPIESAVAHLPKIWVLDTCIAALCHGDDLKIPGISKFHEDIKEGNWVAVMSLKNELIGLGRAKMTSGKIMESKKGIAVEVFKVFMQPGVYTRPPVEKKD